MSAYDDIAALVEGYKAKYPDLNLSFGYIGNLSRHGDDRDFRIFSDRRAAHWSSMSYHLGSADELPKALERLNRGHFDKWAEAALKMERAY